MSLSKYRRAHPEKVKEWTRRHGATYRAKLAERGLTDYQARKLRKIEKIRRLA